MLEFSNQNNFLRQSLYSNSQFNQNSSQRNSFLRKQGDEKINKNSTVSTNISQNSTHFKWPDPKQVVDYQEKLKKKGYNYTILQKKNDKKQKGHSISNVYIHQEMEDQYQNSGDDLKKQNKSLYKIKKLKGKYYTQINSPRNDQRDIEGDIKETESDIHSLLPLINRGPQLQKLQFKLNQVFQNQQKQAQFDSNEASSILNKYSLFSLGVLEEQQQLQQQLPKQNKIGSAFLRKIQLQKMSQQSLNAFPQNQQNQGYQLSSQFPQHSLSSFSLSQNNNNLNRQPVNSILDTSEQMKTHFRYNNRNDFINQNKKVEKFMMTSKCFNKEKKACKDLEGELISFQQQQQQQNQEYRTIFAVYFSSTIRFANYKVIECQIPTQFEEQSDIIHIYNQLKQQNKILQEYAREEFKLNVIPSFMFLITEEPIAFINEIPKNCNVIIMSLSPLINFWYKMSDLHKLKDFGREKQILLIKQINQCKSVKEVNEFINKPQYQNKNLNFRLSKIKQQEWEDHVSIGKIENKFTIADFEERLYKKINKKEKSKKITSFGLILDQQEEKKKEDNQKQQNLFNKVDESQDLSQSDEQIIGKERHAIEKLATYLEMNCFKAKIDTLDDKQYKRQNDYFLNFQKVSPQIMEDLLKQMKKEEKELKKKQLAIQKQIKSPNKKLLRIKSASEDQTIKDHLQFSSEQNIDYLSFESEDCIASQKYIKLLQDNYKDLTKFGGGSIGQLLKIMDNLQSNQFIVSSNKLIQQYYQQQIEEENQNQKHSKKKSNYNIQFLNSQETEIDKRDFVNLNKQKFTLIKYDLQKKYPNLFATNIPLQIKKTQFSRFQLHSLFSKFKALIMYKDLYSKKQFVKHRNFDGIDINIFKLGIESLVASPQNVIEKIFLAKIDSKTGSSSTMDWQSYVNTLEMISSRSLKSKISLLMDLMDDNRNGIIDYSEIQLSCINLLSKFYSSQTSNNDLIELADFMTKTIYNALGLNTDQYLTKDYLEKLVLDQNENNINNPDLDFLFMIIVAQSVDLQEIEEQEPEDLNLVYYTKQMKKIDQIDQINQESDKE